MQEPGTKDGTRQGRTSPGREAARIQHSGGLDVLLRVEYPYPMFNEQWEWCAIGMFRRRRRHLLHEVARVKYKVTRAEIKSSPTTQQVHYNRLVRHTPRIIMRRASRAALDPRSWGTAGAGESAFRSAAFTHSKMCNSLELRERVTFTRADRFACSQSTAQLPHKSGRSVEKQPTMATSNNARYVLCVLFAVYGE